MANNTDLVKEIEEAVSEMTSALAGAEVRHSSIAYLGIPTTEKIQATLQRARDALRWIPCEERLPEKEGYYLVTFETGSVEIDYFIPGHGFDCSPSCPVIAWKERTILSAYTPEEK